MSCVSAIRVQGRMVSEADVESIRQLRQQHPEWSRCQLSEQLAQTWQWRNGAGRLKDMAARTLLLKLQARGLIDLPPALNGNGNAQRCARACAQLELLSPQPDLIAGPLAKLQPVTLELVGTLVQRRRVAQLLQQHHYRGFAGAVGENVQYLVGDGQGRELAVMVFGAAAWKVGARDEFIGWSVCQRRTGLGLVANQQRFLILPWVQVAHLASHLLALAVRRLPADWQARYGHPVWLVETFVEQERFAGTAYKAAGWICVGQTTGRTRQDRQRTLQVPIKTVWVRPLHRHFRKLLTLL
jgi:hypothetical protein